MINKLHVEKLKTNEVREIPFKCHGSCRERSSSGMMLGWYGREVLG